MKSYSVDSPSVAAQLLKRFAAGALLSLAAVGAHAQEMKVGFVNSDRVLREAIPAKAA